jgi:uncharacterized protein YciI
MSADSIEAAYAPFVASLLAGGFGPPPAGEWPAEVIAAHVAANNDLIAETAEKVAAGEDIRYDNAAAVEQDELSRYAARAGGAAGLAREVERSAARLERARQSLGERGETMVHVVIRDHGQIVQDGPVPIGAFIEGNASFHLDLHHEQLKALEPARSGNPPDEFDQYQLVLLERAPDAPVLDEEQSDALQRRHLGHFEKMRAAGLMTVAGPVAADDTIAGICLYRAGTTERARRLAEDDPAVRAGRFVVRVMTWYTAKDAIRWSGDSGAAG